MTQGSYYDPKRPVETPPLRRAAVVAAIAALPADCAQEMLALMLELERSDPDLSSRCGLLDDRYEIFAIRAETCGRIRALVSIDRRVPPHRLTLHGVAEARVACQTARRLATRDHRLVNPPWEKGR